jgi:hypothetical protein
MRKRASWVIELEAQPTADGHQRLAQSIRLIVERATSRRTSRSSEIHAVVPARLVGELGETEIGSE